MWIALANKQDPVRLRGTVQRTINYKSQTRYRTVRLHRDSSAWSQVTGSNQTQNARTPTSLDYPTPSTFNDYYFPSITTGASYFEIETVFTDGSSAGSWTGSHSQIISTTKSCSRQEQLDYWSGTRHRLCQWVEKVLSPGKVFQKNNKSLVWPFAVTVQGNTETSDNKSI